uniref:BMP/retinoic acid-inducible neural-specific protein 2-like n=1 Tax=Myxine glutinosa TaxID=7769 RepID=UPI00358EA015
MRRRLVSLLLAVFLVCPAEQRQGRGKGTSDWLWADRGPFHCARDFVYAAERARQGYSNRYRIHREFARWKVNNVAVSHDGAIGGMEVRAPGLSPGFLEALRGLGRRPQQGALLDGLVRRFGTHLLLSGTLGGEESLTVFVEHGNGDLPADNFSRITDSLHQLTAAYFTERDVTLRRLHEMQISSGHIKVIETRTGPLGCSTYDNLDAVNSVLVQTPENKVQLLGLQAILPEYVREPFVRAALSYLLCGARGWFECRSSVCTCRCLPAHQECNCPKADVRTTQATVLRLQQKWDGAQRLFEASVEFQSFVQRLPMSHFLSKADLFRLWANDRALQRRYDRFRTTLATLRRHKERASRHLYLLSRACVAQTDLRLQAERTLSYWMGRLQALIYCSGHGSQSGSFTEHPAACVCPSGRPLCQHPLPCVVGHGEACAACAARNASRCGACNIGYKLQNGRCQPEAAVPQIVAPYMMLESELDLQDLELQYLLQRRDKRLVVVDAAFVSNELALGSWFDLALRKRMLLTRRSNRLHPGSLHLLLGLSLQLCRAETAPRNTTPGGADVTFTASGTVTQVTDPREDFLLIISVNPFGGSHSESWQVPIGRNGYPGWERAEVVAGTAGGGTAWPGGVHCQNWTLVLGNRWKSFFETVHIYLRKRGGKKMGQPWNGTKTEADGKSKARPAANASPPQRNLMKVSALRILGYSLPFNTNLFRTSAQRVSHEVRASTKSSHPAAITQHLLSLSELRGRVNRLAPPSRQAPFDIFSCLLRRRLRLNGTETAAVNHALDAFEYGVLGLRISDTTKLCL